MPYPYVSNSEIKEANDLIVQLITEQLEETNSNYSLTYSFEKIGLNNTSSSYIVLEIEDKYGVRINASPRIKSGNSIDLSTPEKRKLGILEKILSIFIPEMAKEVFGGNTPPSPPYEPDETGHFYKDCCYLSPQDVLDTTFRQMSEKRKMKEEERMVLQKLARGEE